MIYFRPPGNAISFTAGAGSSRIDCQLIHSGDLLWFAAWPAISVISSPMVVPFALPRVTLSCRDESNGTIALSISYCNKKLLGIMNSLRYIT